MTVLLIVSLILPGFAGAQTQSSNLTIEEEVELEKQRAQDPDDFINGDNTKAINNGIPNLLDGINFDTKPAFDEDDFVLGGKVETDIVHKLDNEGTANIIVRLKDSVDMQKLSSTVSAMNNRTERVGTVVDQLKATAQNSQAGFLADLQKLEDQKIVSSVKPFWVINGVAATISKEALEILANREDVVKITLDREFQVPEVTVEEAPPRLPEWGLEKIFAPKVWGEYGVQGDGIVVGIMDTGVEGNHEALAHNYRGKDGNHQYSWIDVSGQGYKTPSDGHGHGTHVAGSAVGGGAGEPVGVAPGAEWIAAKIFTDGGGTTASAIHTAFEWFLAPGGDPSKAPHVVNNSWGSADTYRTEFLDGVKAWVAAGIFPLFAAGNDGPGSQTIGSPGSFPEAFAIGATDSGDQIASFSSRGPVFWTNENGEQKRYVKPEVSAPGHRIYSAWPGNGYNTISGTSMATPHVAGAIALILQSNPNLTIDEVASILENTARTEAHMGAVPNDTYGHGIVNVYQAVTEVAYAGEVKGTLLDEDGNGISGEIKFLKEGSSFTVKDGEVNFKVREGIHEIEVYSFGYHGLKQTIEVNKGEVTQVAWTLEEAERFDVTGTVTYENGSPVAFAYVRVVGAPLETARTNENGQFSINAIPQDNYTLVVNGQGIKQKSVSVDVTKNMTVNITVSTVSIDSQLDWSTSKNNNSRNAVSIAEVDAEKLAESWSFTSPGQVLFSSPVIAEGKVVFTTDRGYVIVLDQNSGEEQWSVRTGNTNRSTPTVVDGTVYVAGGSDALIYAIDLVTGMTKWTKRLEYPAIYEAPIYDNGVLYVTSYLSNDAKAVALNANNGDKIWEANVGNESFFGAAMGEDTLFVATYASRQIKAISKTDGSEKWTVTADNQGFAASPVYHDGVIYAVSVNFSNGSGTLHAYNASNGNKLWSTTGIGDTQAGSPIIFDDLVVIGSAANTYIKAFNKNTGELVWETNNGSTMVNTGAISGNGYLFVTDLASNLNVYDVFTGEKLSTYSLKNISTAGVALTEGQVVVGDHSGVTSFEAPGTLSGTIKGKAGQPVQAKITLLNAGKSVEADENGKYVMSAHPGTYEVKIAYYGLQQSIEEIKFISGYSLNQDFTLEDAGTGSISGTVKNKRSGVGLEGVTISVVDTPLQVVTDSQGNFSFTEVYEGAFDVQFSIGGYVDSLQTINVVAGENTLVPFDMTPVDVVVLDDHNGDIVRFLNNNNISAEERGWDVVEDISSYQVLYMNGTYRSMGNRPDKESFDNLINAAKENDVSVVFADTWGISYGSLRLLWEFYGDPAQYDSDYYNATVRLRVDEEHPILDGLEKGGTYTIHHNGDLAWFNQYSGRHLATVGSSRIGMVGSGIAYKAVSEESAHLLLSTHSASPWVSPYNGWLTPQQQILINGVNFLLDASYGQISGAVVDEEGNTIEATVEVIETGVNVQVDGTTGQYELFHDDGVFNVAFRKGGYATKFVEVTFENGQPLVENVVMEVSNSGTISGQVVNKISGQSIPYAEIELYDEEGILVESSVSSINGNYEITGLDEARYELKIVLRDYVTHTERIEVGSEPISLNIEMYPAPKVGIIGDATTGSLRGILDGVGIEATNYTNIANITPHIENLDVIFFNDQSVASVTLEALESFLAEADKHEVSVIFGDTYWTGSGLNHLVNRFGDPKSRTTHRDYNSSAGYVVLEENPIFGNSKVGDFIDILLPNRSDIAYFEGYSGYPLATIKHQDHTNAHGLGIAYKPRTSSSMELLMGGHGISFTHDARHYTQNGLDIFVNAILWAAYVEYNTVEGTITDQDGNPVYAKVEIEEFGISTWTNPETGYFTLAALDGEYELEISSFGYQDKNITVNIDEDLEEQQIKLDLKEDNGSLEGKFVDDNPLEGGVEGVHIDVVGYPREGTTDSNGEVIIDRLEPGTYTLMVTKEGYVQLEIDVEITPNGKTILKRNLKPSPTIGVIVDAQTSSSVKLEDYLTGRGYIVEQLYYTDLDRIKDMDLIFANSDYNNSLNPEKGVFVEFLKELDRTETPVIWPGNGGPRGSIRFLVEHIGNPASHVMGGLSAAQQTLEATVLAEHPIFEGVATDEDGKFKYTSRYYNGFSGYTGTTIATANHSVQGDLGSLVAYGGRTLNSVEVLLASMTFGYGFTEGGHFDQNRERIVNNAILWALDNKEELVGEIHGQVSNNFDRNVKATITVEETGYTFETEQDGSFFLALDSGTYTLTIEGFGHHSESFEVDVVRGDKLNETFVLTSEDAGLVKGQVKSVDTNQGVEGATIQLVGTPLRATTDAQGFYELQAPVGEYSVRVAANGYSPQVISAIVGDNEEVTVNFTLSISEKIAVVGTAANNNRIIPLLETNGYEAIAWVNSNIPQLMEELDEYALVILNDRNTSAMPEAVFKQFIDLADSLSISIIFPSQFSGGTIRDLNAFYGDPQQVAQGFVPNHINYKVTEKHPIFAGYEVGDVIRIADNGNSNQQYSLFENYSGTRIADLTHDANGRIGSGLAYEFRTANSVHLLLGSLQAGSYGSPDVRWTDDAKQIYINAVDWALSASLGEINGVVTDVEGNPIQGASVTIPGQGATVQTNGEGFYRLGVGIGEYEVRVQARGFVPQTQTATIEELGQLAELNFEMEQTDRMNLSGNVTDLQGNGLSGAVATLVEKEGNFEESVETNKDGYYQFDELLAGEYRLTVEVNGYQTVESDIKIEAGENVVLDFTLSDFNIAVLGDVKEAVSTFLNENGHAAQRSDWDIVNDVYNYEIIIVNSSKATEEQVNKLIEESDKYETSLIFVDTWGNDGSLPLLEKAIGNPTRAEHGYNQGAVYLDIKPHELFEGLGNGPIRIHSDKSPYSTFKDYEGITLASLIVDGVDKGASIAYDFRSENHMHLLLSSYAVNNMIGPKQGWTNQGQQLYLQAIEWAKDGVQSLPILPVWSEETVTSSDGSATVTGTAEYRTTVQVLHGEEVLATVTPKRDGTFTVELQGLADGSYELVLKASNFAGDVVSENALTLLVDTQAPELTVASPTTNFVTGKEVADVNGSVTDANLDRVEVNGKAVDVNKNGEFSTRTILVEGTNTITIEAFDTLGHSTKVERTVTVILGSPVLTDVTPSSDQYVKPGEKIEVSFRSESFGGNASFSIKLPASIASTNETSSTMVEVEPGFYKGTWTVPTNTNLQGAIVEVKLVDVAGNKGTAQASGKLYISSEQINRIFGTSRIDTAIETSKNGWASSDVVVLARGDNYADALAGVPLAHKLGAPILLTRSTLATETLKEIERLGATNVIVLGGELAVSEGTVNTLKSKGLEVRRIAGANRYETAALIAKEVAPNGAEKAVVVSGRNFPDALSVASHAAKQGLPILLTNTNVLPESTESALNELGVTSTIVIGGSLVVTDTVMATLPNPERVSGTSRYDTNVEVAKKFGVTNKHMYVATGIDFADALTGAVLAAKNDSAILLVGNNVPGVVSQFMTSQGVERVTIFGGEIAVSKEVESALERILP